MAIEQASLWRDQPVDQPSPEITEETTKHLSPWQELNLGGERFLLKRDRLFPTEHDGRETTFHINEYHHPETGIQIQVWNLGMDRPQNEPALVRADYGCPCMVLGASHKSPSHDCAAQRDMMLQTMEDIGIGAMAVVSEHVAAGNGHGSHAVFDQSTIQHLARQRGEEPPSMQQFYGDQGYDPFDARRHDLVARTLAHTLGQRPSISAMSSSIKNRQLQEGGVNLIPGIRIELHTDPSGFHGNLLRRNGYAERLHHSDPGPYLVVTNSDNTTTSGLLTSERYRALFQSPKRKSPRARHVSN